MVYQRKFLTDIVNILKAKYGVTEDTMHYVKSFAAKLMTEITKEILFDMMPRLREEGRPGEFWILGLKAILPIYWYCIERIPKEKLAEWANEYVKEGIVPREAVETLKSMVEEYILNPEKFVELPELKQKKAATGLYRLLQFGAATGYHVASKFANAIRAIAERVGVVTSKTPATAPA